MKILKLTTLLACVATFLPCGSLLAGELQFIVIYEEAFEGAKRVEVPELDLVGWRKENPHLSAARLTAVALKEESVSRWSQLNTEMQEIHSGAYTNCEIVISVDSNTQNAIKMLTEENVGKRMLLQYGETPLIAPEIRVPIDTPRLSISLRNRAKAEALHGKLKVLIEAGDGER